MLWMAVGIFQPRNDTGNRPGAVVAARAGRYRWAERPLTGIRDIELEPFYHERHQGLPTVEAQVAGQGAQIVEEDLAWQELRGERIRDMLRSQEQPRPSGTQIPLRRHSLRRDPCLRSRVHTLDVHQRPVRALGFLRCRDLPRLPHRSGEFPPALGHHHSKTRSRPTGAKEGPSVP